MKSVQPQYPIYDTLPRPVSWHEATKIIEAIHFVLHSHDHLNKKLYDLNRGKLIKSSLTNDCVGAYLKYSLIKSSC